jgi:HK97 family phage prohead protease
MMLLVSPSRFKQLHRKGGTPGAIMGLRKQMIAPADPGIAGNDKRVLRWTISTGCIDRERDCISVNGWDLGNYKQNPVVLWGHDGSSLPIGRAFDIGVEGDALKASVEFIPADTPERGQFAEAVYRLAKDGFLAATSVGFRPTKWAFTDDPERGADDWFPGIDFEQQELVEFSVVTVPANPEALIDPMEASDTPPETGEELTSLTDMAARAAMTARRRRVLALAQVTGG